MYIHFQCNDDTRAPLRIQLVEGKITLSVCESSKFKAIVGVQPVINQYNVSRLE